MEHSLSLWGPIAFGVAGGAVAWAVWSWRRYYSHLAKVEGINNEIAALNQKHYELNNKHYEAARDTVELLREIKALLEAQRRS